MSRSVPILAVLFLLFPLAIWGQHEGRHGATTGTSAPPAVPAEDPAIATFNHAIAVQATGLQVDQFRLMMKRTEAAQQSALDLQRVGANPNESDNLFSKLNGLQDSAEEAQSENRAFRRSLSDSQEAGLKNLTRKLGKSDAAVSKAVKAIAQQLDQGTLDPGRVVNAAATLEKALTSFRADQLNLGKEMGIQPH